MSRIVHKWTNLIYVSILCVTSPPSFRPSLLFVPLIHLSDKTNYFAVRFIPQKRKNLVAKPSLINSQRQSFTESGCLDVCFSSENDKVSFYLLSKMGEKFQTFMPLCVSALGPSLLGNQKSYNLSLIAPFNRLFLLLSWIMCFLFLILKHLSS